VLYLHKNGTYGYKDGAPVKDKNELAAIADPIARKLALHWWQVTGQNLSDEHYQRREAQLEELAMRGVAGAEPGDNTSLDQVMYMRRPIKDRRRAAYSDPSTWQSFFDQRPAWWGLASVIEISGYRYERIDPEAEEQLAGDEEKHDLPEAPTATTDESPAAAAPSPDEVDL
jgi:hypothetical protein